MKYVFIAAVVVANDALVLIAAFVNALIIVEYDIIHMYDTDGLVIGGAKRPQANPHP